MADARNFPNPRNARINPGSQHGTEKEPPSNWKGLSKPPIFHLKMDRWIQRFLASFWVGGTAYLSGAFAVNFSKVVYLNSAESHGCKQHWIQLFQTPIAGSKHYGCLCKALPRDRNRTYRMVQKRSRWSFQFEPNISTCCIRIYSKLNVSGDFSFWHPLIVKCSGM